MKKILLSAALLAPAAAVAQDCLVVLTADGQRHAHEMGTVGKITFSGGVMSVGCVCMTPLAAWWPRWADGAARPWTSPPCPRECMW